MAEMPTRCFSILMIYLSFIVSMSQGFKFRVIQPHTQKINPNRSASISCEHKANASRVLDVRLIGIQSGRDPKILCRMGKKPCQDIILKRENDNKFSFFMSNLGKDAVRMKYQCSFTVEHKMLHYDGKGDTPTTLLEVLVLGKNGTECKPPVDRWTHLEFILIGLLAPTFLYSCVITFFCIRRRVKRGENSGDPENSTYVEMRKAPTQRNPEFDMMCYERLNNPTSNRIPPQVA